jgi:energy-coupling factor transporter ATP-binding protein EcfA2
MEFSGSNFQSWPEFSLPLNGLTVVIGPSNKGKSALFRALRGILRNELPAASVRLGQKNPLKLTLKVDGHSVTATRARDDSSVYYVDGERFAKLAEAIPDGVKKLGFGEIKVGNFTVDPIFAIQNDPQFLLDKKAYGPLFLNTVLGAFGGTEKLEVGKKEANVRIAQKNSEAKTLSFEIAEAHSRKDTLEKLAEVSGHIANEVHALESSARRLEARAGWMTLTHQRLERLVRMREVLDSLPSIETIEIENLQKKVFSLRAARAARFRVVELADDEQWLTAVSSGWADAKRLYWQIRALREIGPLLEQNEASTRIADAVEMNAIIGRLEDIIYRVARLQDSINYIGQVNQIRARAAELQHQRLHVESERDAAAKVKCPQCGTEF